MAAFRPIRWGPRIRLNLESLVVRPGPKFNVLKFHFSNFLAKFTSVLYILWGKLAALLRPNRRVLQQVFNSDWANLKDTEYSIYSSWITTKHVNVFAFSLGRNWRTIQSHLWYSMSLDSVCMSMNLQKYITLLWVIFRTFWPNSKNVSIYFDAFRPIFKQQKMGRNQI